MWKYLKSILLEALGFLMQQVVGSSSNWILGPVVYATHGPWVTFLIMLVVNVSKLMLMIYVYDKMVGFFYKNKSAKKKSSKNNNYRRVKRLLRYGHKVLGIVAIVGNNFYGVRLVRRKHRGIPKSTWPTVFWGIFASTFVLVLVLSGAFSVWALIQEELNEIFYFLIPFLIRLYF